MLHLIANAFEELARLYVLIAAKCSQEKMSRLILNKKSLKFSSIVQGKKPKNFKLTSVESTEF